MTTLSADFTRKVADLYIQKRNSLEKLDPTKMETFATETLDIINKEKKKSDALHDLKILDYNMGLLKHYSVAFKKYEPETDEYDFTQNDCKNVIYSTKRWLKLEGLI